MSHKKLILSAAALLVVGTVCYIQRDAIGTKMNSRLRSPDATLPALAAFPVFTDTSAIAADPLSALASSAELFAQKRLELTDAFAKIQSKRKAREVDKNRYKAEISAKESDLAAMNKTRLNPATKWPITEKGRPLSLASFEERMRQTYASQKKTKEFLLGCETALAKDYNSLSSIENIFIAIKTKEDEIRHYSSEYIREQDTPKIEDIVKYVQDLDTAKWTEEAKRTSLADTAVLTATSGVSDTDFQKRFGTRTTATQNTQTK
ncbi:MAG: hypothetical protein LBT53_03035 [Puniceicoccales bacterium]|jgi:hypothetical protein|nr:hypothetical protein [Puniceicoccales bacterium]